MTPHSSYPIGDAKFVRGGGKAGAVIRAIDWRDTPLGPAVQWPQSLRTALSICLRSRFPIALYWGPQFVMLYNDALFPMVGANKHPWAMGRPAFEVLPEIRHLIEPLFAEVIATGEAIWQEDTMLPLDRGDGPQEGYFTFTYSPIEDESAGVGGVFCAVLETTEKVIEERRLRLLNTLAKTHEARSPTEACELAAAQLLDAPNDVPFAVLYLVDEHGTTRLAGTTRIAPGAPLAPAAIAPGDHSCWPLDGDTHFVEIANGPHGARGAAILPIDRVGGGPPVGFLVAGVSGMLRRSPSYDRFHKLVAASISQGINNALAYDAERKRAEALAKLDRAKTTFFSNVSHEFRTPLTLMLAPIQDMLTQPNGSAIDRANVELLHRNALRLLKLVNTLLEFSRIEAGRVDAVYRPVALAALTTDLASGFRTVVERAGLTFTVECTPLAEPVFIDQSMWEKVVLNLLSNAFKFTFAGSIGVRLATIDGAAQLEVTDTGIGVAATDLPRLFERFHRIEGARSRSHEGSGIGLALIHELVQLHGGSVAVTSEPDVGTRFVVRIPHGAAHLPADRIDTTPTLPSTAVAPEAFLGEIARWDAPPTEAEPPTSGLRATSRERIVIADDNADMREYVARLLGERWRVEAVADGEAALAAIRRDPPALVLSDVMMPNLDGFELIQAVRGDDALRAIPVILLSARAGEEETARGLSAGANDYIAKPFSARELLVRVTATIEGARASRDLRIQRDNLYRQFAQSPFPVAVLQGPSHVVELANDAILRLWGKTAVVFGLPLIEVLPALRDQPFIGYLDGVFCTGTSHVGRAERHSLPSGPGGELVTTFFNFVYAALRDPSGAITGVLVSAFDVTEVVRAQQLAERAVIDRQSLLDFQERFVAILGHDLRNPLASIDMTLGLLRQRATDAADTLAGRYLGRAESSTRRMSRMIEQILDFSRIRIAGGLTVEPKPMDLATMLGGIVDELRVAHPDRTIAIACPSIAGSWDRDRLEQVFSNLIGNAVHHGAVTAPITVRGASFEDRVEIQVHNTGDPIPDALRATLFDPFRRGDRDSRTRNTAGLGLGLYISYQIVAAHGGAIDIASSASEGTTFQVTLPKDRR